MHFEFRMFPLAGRETALISRSSWISKGRCELPFFGVHEKLFRWCFKSSETEVSKVVIHSLGECLTTLLACFALWFAFLDSMVHFRCNSHSLYMCTVYVCMQEGTHTNVTLVPAVDLQQTLNDDHTLSCDWLPEQLQYHCQLNQFGLSLTTFLFSYRCCAVESNSWLWALVWQRQTNKVLSFRVYKLKYSHKHFTEAHLFYMAILSGATSVQLSMKEHV